MSFFFKYTQTTSHTSSQTKHAVCNRGRRPRKQMSGHPTQQQYCVHEIFAAASTRCFQGDSGIQMKIGLNISLTTRMIQICSFMGVRDREKLKWQMWLRSNSSDTLIKQRSASVWLIHLNSTKTSIAIRKLPVLTFLRQPILESKSKIFNFVAFRWILYAPKD